MNDVKPERRLEQCCVCDEATGRAGQADDSIFVELPNGFNHGPLCESCHAEAMAHLEMWEKHATELAETITDREAKIAELTSAIEDAYREGWDDASQRPEDAITLEDLESDWRNSKASTTI